MIRSFLGLCNFFRGHIHDYATISATLNRLLRKDLQYCGKEIPVQAEEAFTRLKRILCSKPNGFPKPRQAACPHHGRLYGRPKFCGWLGAILTQIDNKVAFQSSRTRLGCFRTKKSTLPPSCWKCRQWCGRLGTSNSNCGDNAFSCSRTTNHFKPAQKPTGNLSPSYSFWLLTWTSRVSRT